MTEIVAAHLERVARERTAEIVACAASEFCPHKTIEGCIETVLAAALAACAREVLREVNADAEADMLKGNPITGAHHRAIERKLVELERA